ncbi:MAG TPA: DivIVA domain-containing protein [Solirubrobacteraceae bacterium]
MSAVELDRQGIERRDFPIVRRGYDPASVDAHLRALAAEVDELQREATSRGGESLASSAGTQVQGILEAAQATAETIERQAAEQAHEVREAADEDARRTREEAVAHAQEHVAAVSQATEALLVHVGSLDEETRALVESMRSGAGRLAGDLAAVESEMEALYDAASGRAGTGQSVSAQRGSHGNGAPHASVAAQVAATEEARAEPNAQAYVDEFFEPQPGEPAFDEQPLFPDEPVGEPSSGNDDLDGARLVALNMALNGDSREDTGQYLRENFEVPDRERLLDEVYAAIEG